MGDLSVAFYKTIKLHSKCVICKNPSIQWHHVSPKHKIDEVAKVAHRGDLTAVMAELNKCIPLCQVHHTGVHKGVIPGYLDGKYDKGGIGFDDYARPFMPYLNFFARRHRRVLLDFYVDHIEREHRAYLPVLQSIGFKLPHTLKWESP